MSMQARRNEILAAVAELLYAFVLGLEIGISAAVWTADLWRPLIFR